MEATMEAEATMAMEAAAMEAATKPLPDSTNPSEKMDFYVKIAIF